MSKITNLSKNAASLLLSGALLLTSSGFVISALRKEAEMTAQKETVIAAMIANEKAFSEQYVSYDKYIELIKQEIIDTEMHTSAMDVFAAYCLLQNNGLISLGDEFSFGVADYEITGNMGISVITGKSVCRNQAYNLYRLFEALGYETSVSYGELYTTDFISGNNNHAVTCVHENGIYYLFDPTNNTIFLRTALGQFKSMDRENEKFYPSPYGDEIFSTLSDNAGLHVYFGDDYGSIVTFQTRREKSETKAKQSTGYYADFETKYLEEIEKEIDADFREYFDLETPAIEEIEQPEDIEVKVLQKR